MKVLGLGWDSAGLKFRIDNNDHLLKFCLTSDDYDDQSGAIRQGTVLILTGQSSLGRTQPNPKGVARVAILKNQCINVLESSSHDISGHSGVADKSIWVRALPYACNS
jgi:hypothetical protein